MAQHQKLVGLMGPVERFARSVNAANATARSQGTRKAGSLYIPNADGTATIIGEQAGTDETGAPAGRVDFYGDTVPPSVPTGVTYGTGDGRLHAFWDGSLTDGVPADFAFVEFYAGEAFMGRLVKAGSLTWDGAETGSAYRCTACAVDVQGNESAATEAVEVTVRDTVAEVNADVAEVKEKAAALEAELDTTNQKVTQVVSDVEGVKTTAENAVEKADQSLTVATEAKQTATEVKTTADKAYADAESALTQSSEAKQTADALSSKVTEAVDTANSAKTSATTAVQTVDSFKTEVSETYLTKDDAGTTYATKSSLTETADSITAKVEAAQATGDDALALAKGGISKVEVQYAQNQSTTTAPTDGWSTTAPTWKDGYYVWQKTVTTYKDGTTTESDPTCISGAKGATGATGAAGADGVGYKANLIIGSADGGTDYALGSGTWVDGGWSGHKAVATNKAWNGAYIHTKDIAQRNNLAAGTTMTASIYVSCDSDTAQKVVLSAHRFNTATNTQTGSSITPTLESGKWYRWVLQFKTNEIDTMGNLARFECRTSTDFNILWSCPMLTVGTDVPEWSYAASELVGNGVSSITPQYYLSTSATECTGGSWSTTMPTWTSGTYIWTRSHVVYTDGTTADTEAVLDSQYNDLAEDTATNAANVETLKTDVSSQLTILANSISSLVVDAQGKSQMTQTADGWRFDVSKLTTAIEGVQDQAAENAAGVASTKTSIENLTNNVDKLLVINDYMSYSDGVLELGSTGSDFKLQLTKERISFIQGSSEVAYISDTQLYIMSAIVTDELKIGNGAGYVWKYRANGHMGLRYTEG